MDPNTKKSDLPPPQSPYQPNAQPGSVTPVVDSVLPTNQTPPTFTPPNPVDPTLAMPTTADIAPPKRRLSWPKLVIGLIILAAVLTGVYFLFLAGNTKTNVSISNPAQSDNSLQLVKSAGVLKIGTSLEELPWGAYDQQTGKAVGAEVEIANVLGEKLGVKIDLVNLGFDDLIPQLVAKKFDVTMAGMSITDERKQKINFTDPYYVSGQEIVVRSSETTIKDVNSLAGKKVGVLSGTTSEIYAKDLKLSPAADVRSYDTPGKYFTDLTAKTIDAVIYDSVAANYYAKTNPGFKIVSGKLTSEGYGIGVRKEDNKLREALNTAISDLKSDQRYVAIVNKWYE